MPRSQNSRENAFLRVLSTLSPMIGQAILIFERGFRLVSFIRELHLLDHRCIVRLAAKAKVTKAFLDALEAARLIHGKPIRIASAYRCKKHNAEIGGGKDSAHTRGTAIDPVRPAGGKALLDMIAAFTAAGFHGFGMGKRGSKQLLHFDIDQKLGPRAWMY